MLSWIIYFFFPLTRNDAAERCECESIVNRDMIFIMSVWHVYGLQRPDSDVRFHSEQCALYFWRCNRVTPVSIITYHVSRITFDMLSFGFKWYFRFFFVLRAVLNVSISLLPATTRVWSERMTIHFRSQQINPVHLKWQFEKHIARHYHPSDFIITLRCTFSTPKIIWISRHWWLRLNNLSVSLSMEIYCTSTIYI